jgi:hypothetical protein
MFEWDHRVSNGWNADTWCLGKHIDEWCNLPGRRRLVGRCQRGDGLLPAAGAHAAPLLDHGAAGGGDQPRPRVAGDALLGQCCAAATSASWTASSQPAKSS